MCHLGSFNCSTHLPVWCRNELAAFAVANNVDILAIQEHHIQFDGVDPVRRLEHGKEWLLLAIIWWPTQDRYVFRLQPDLFI